MTEIISGLTSHHYETTSGESRSVRTTFNEQGEILTVAKDVCETLGISKYRDYIATIPAWARVSRKVDTLGGQQEMVCFTEAGVNLAVLRSHKPEAEPLQRYICCEVIPQLRKTGVFIPGATASERAEALRQLLHAERAIARAEAKKARVLAEGPIPRRSVARRKDVYPRPEGWLTIPEFVREKLGEGNLHIERCGKSLGWKCRDAIEGETCAWVQGSSTQKRRAYPPAFLEERWPQVLLATGVIVGGKEGA